MTTTWRSEAQDLLDVAGRYATYFQRSGSPEQLEVVREFLRAAGRLGAALTAEQRERLSQGRQWLRAHTPADGAPPLPKAKRVQCPALCVPCGVCEGGCGLTAAGWPVVLAEAEAAARRRGD